MRYVLLVSYDGTDYGGWQIQKNAVSVQSKLSDALEDTFGRKVSVTASGRTDSGVHARAQVCHFDVDTTIPAAKIADALNARLPQDISVLKSAVAPQGFDALSGAKKKTYCYRFYLSKRRLPLYDRYAVQINYFADMQKLSEAGKMFEGRHDFKAYCASGSQVKTTVRTVYGVKISNTDGLIEVFVTGNGFLYNMVRTIVGTMLYYSAGRIPRENIALSLTSGDRSLVGKTLPAKGLTLESVDYGFQLF